MSDHETWVTERVRQWFAAERPAWVPAQVTEIREENARAVADGFDGNDDTAAPLAEDVEYLADKAEQFALHELLAYGGTEIVRDFTRDCLSEADWYELAAEWLSRTEESK